MVDVAKYFLNFLQDESCGKCVPCRLGTDRMLEILTDITEGRGRMEQLDTLEGPGLDHVGRLALRAGQDGAQPGALHPALLRATSTRPTSRSGAARPASARRCCAYEIDPDLCTMCGDVRRRLSARRDLRGRRLPHRPRAVRAVRHLCRDVCPSEAISRV